MLTHGHAHVNRSDEEMASDVDDVEAQLLEAEPEPYDLPICEVLDLFHGRPDGLTIFEVVAVLCWDRGWSSGQVGSILAVAVMARLLRLLNSVDGLILRPVGGPA